ncbi:MAG TPA: RNA polymerase factor sigma-54 [Dokdonella sp.]|uniref:RNA polymerase factor sigma-54 n=1 Tax=Dokdonella sp. TaxID=2291710 RepID=UPI002D7F9791|nr:RNA polymerase factor sigma-54 [Dokdonella sp.]HET9033347.1 RNA polymerase factor sigma-54 [Dokdonella sp.]
MKPALQLRVQAQLALTPQLQQAIKLLQLSSIELETELNLALESNPLLDIDESEPEEEEVEDFVPPEHTLSAKVETSDSQSDEPADSTPDFDDIPLNLGEDRRDYRGNNTDNEGMESQDAETTDLRDHLLWQLNLTPLSPVDRGIATAIIEAINDDGYLEESSEIICTSLADLYSVDEDQVEAVRHRIQQFDPLGVASRSLSECLGVQLAAMDETTPGLDKAQTLVDDCLDILARNDRTRLCQRLRCNEEELDVVIALIRSLNPRPGSGFSNAAPEFIAPDAYAHRVNGRWQVSLSPHCQPRLAINEHYASLISQAQRDDAIYMRGQLQEARWLIKSLKTRAETVLKVAQAIVNAQANFLDFGAEAMRPLVLRDVAEEIEMHESTVSRVTTRKYLHTPRGTFEFKYFFSSGVSTVDGGAASATAIQAMIRKLIDEEKAARPMSDQALAVELNRRGISVARRTVAKYREALNIPSSNDRCRLG